MSSITTDLTDFPLASETQKYLESALIGHVIDGDVVASRSGETMPIIDPATGAEIGWAAAGGPDDVEQAVTSARRAFDDGRWRYLAPLEKERRLRRLSELVAEHADVFGEIDVIDAGLLKVYTGFIVQATVDAVDYYAGWPTKLRHDPRSAERLRCLRRARAGRRDRTRHAVERTDVRARLHRRRARARELRGAQAGRADADGRGAGGRAARSRPGSRPASFNVVQGTGETVGAALVAHPGVDAISFTGSVATGRRIQAAAAPRA